MIFLNRTTLTNTVRKTKRFEFIRGNFNFEGEPCVWLFYLLISYVEFKKIEIKGFADQYQKLGVNCIPLKYIIDISAVAVDHFGKIRSINAFVFSNLFDFFSDVDF